MASICIKNNLYCIIIENLYQIGQRGGGIRRCSYLNLIFKEAPIVFLPYGSYTYFTWHIFFLFLFLLFRGYMFNCSTSLINTILYVCSFKFLTLISIHYWNNQLSSKDTNVLFSLKLSNKIPLIT